MYAGHHRLPWGHSSAPLTGPVHRRTEILQRSLSLTQHFPYLAPLMEKHVARRIGRARGQCTFRKEKRFTSSLQPLLADGLIRLPQPQFAYSGIGKTKTFLRIHG